MSENSRIGPLAILPLFHRLVGRKVVVVGASPGAEWKADLLAATGARVERIASDWTEDQLTQAVLAVGEFAGRHEAKIFADAARRQGALVNIIDFPQLCDVQFGTIVNRSPIVIGISTDGAAPMLGQAIRARIETNLPFGLSAWAAAAKDWRVRVKQGLGEFSERRRFWQEFVSRAWANADRPPTDADLADLINNKHKTGGRAVFVAAWSPNPEDLTLKAVHALQSATVILYDASVSREVLELGRREARRIAVGIGDDEICRSKAGIEFQIVNFVNAGEAVVYLTSLGIPAVHHLAEAIRGALSGTSISIILGALPGSA